MSTPDPAQLPPNGGLTSPSSSSPSGPNIGLRPALALLVVSAPSVILGWRALPALMKAFVAAAERGDWKACAICGAPLFFLLLRSDVGIEQVRSLGKAVAKRIGGDK